MRTAAGDSHYRRRRSWRGRNIFGRSLVDHSSSDQSRTRYADTELAARPLGRAAVRARRTRARPVGRLPRPQPAVDPCGCALGHRVGRLRHRAGVPAHDRRAGCLAAFVVAGRDGDGVGRAARSRRVVRHPYLFEPRRAGRRDRRGAARRATAGRALPAARARRRTGAPTMTETSLPVRLAADLLLLVLLAWIELGRLRRLLADAIAPGSPLPRAQRTST